LLCFFFVFLAVIVCIAATWRIQDEYKLAAEPAALLNGAVRCVKTQW